MTSQTASKALILDWGGVICLDPAPGFIRVLAPQLQCTPAQLAPAVHKHIDYFQRGGSEQAFWQLVCADLQVAVPSTALWKNALKSIYEPNWPLIHWVQEKRQQGYLTCLLSNTEAPAQEFHLSLGYDFFDARIFSCEVQLAKPDPQIYELSAKTLGIKTSECLMIDDKVENIHGAIQAGMQGFHYRNHADLAILMP